MVKALAKAEAGPSIVILGIREQNKSIWSHITGCRHATQCN